MYLLKNQFDIVCTSSKGNIAYSEGPMNGLVHSLYYQLSTALALSDTSLLSLESEITGMKMLDEVALGAASRNINPRWANSIDSTGGALSTDANSLAKIPIVNERLKLTVAASSAALLTGTFYVFTEGGA